MTPTLCFICDTNLPVKRSVTGRMLCQACQERRDHNCGIAFTVLAQDLARTSERILASADRAEGRVRAPNHFPASPFDN